MPAHADHQVRLAAQHRPDEQGQVARVVAAVALHEDDGAGAARERGAGARQTGVAVPAPRLVDDPRAARLEQLATAVARAVVDEDRALEEPGLGGELGEQAGQRRGLVQDRDDDHPRASAVVSGRPDPAPGSFLLRSVL